MTVNYQEILERLTEINQAFGQMYFAIYSVDLESGYYLEVSTLDIFREHIPPRERNQLLFDMVIKYYVSEGYQDGMRVFLDMSTLQERLAQQNAVSNEFFGTTQGWCRASFVVEKRDESGKVLRFVYVTQEINEEVKTEQERIAELKAAYAAVENANRAKTDFLFKMSHDIRTPLNAIIGFNELIEANAGNPKKVLSYAGRIRTSGNLLLTLLNEILDMTKVESGKAVLDIVSFRLSDLVRELSMVIRAQTSAKKQVFMTEQRAIRHEVLRGDRARISRVLFNILSNAVRYTPEGGEIHFRVREEEGDGGTPRFLFSVEDSGVGITPECRDRIFEEFYRGTDAIVCQIPGTGLGLSIAKSFTELMGGEISLASEPGKGSVFTISLPIEPDGDGAPKREENAETEDDPVLEGLTVLIVEDNDLNMEIISELLALSGARCVGVSSGEAAVAKFKSGAEAFDLILMDVQMPGMDGYETTRRIRHIEGEQKGNGTGGVPIIALTANAFAEDVENARLSGMDAHIAKPIDMAALTRTVREVLTRREEETKKGGREWK